MPAKKLSAAEYMGLAIHDRNSVELTAPQSPTYIADWVVCFHAQQAVEKALKALVTEYKIDMDMEEHSIAYLFSMLENAGFSIPADLERAERLTPCGVPTRYGQPVRKPINIKRAEFLGLVDSVLAWIESVLKKKP